MHCMYVNIGIYRYLCIYLEGFLCIYLEGFMLSKSEKYNSYIPYLRLCASPIWCMYCTSIVGLSQKNQRQLHVYLLRQLSIPNHVLSNKPTICSYLSSSNSSVSSRSSSSSFYLSIHLYVCVPNSPFIALNVFFKMCINIHLVERNLEFGFQVIKRHKTLFTTNSIAHEFSFG